MTIHSVIPATPQLWTAPAPSARASVVALHCSLSSGLQWARLAETLGDKFQFIAPDISGYGHAGPSIDPPATLAHEIELINDRLGEAVGPIHLVGHSYGGAIAFETATDSPFAA
jgi:pimeloyl-ACP methyl ester carboxylesterase